MLFTRKHYRFTFIAFSVLIVAGMTWLAASLPAVAASGIACGDRSIEVGGLERSYIVCVPPKAIAPMPLVITFPGSLMNAAMMLRSDGWHALFAGEGAITVYANACTRRSCGGVRKPGNPAKPLQWAESRQIEDEDYVLTVVEAVDREFGVDRAHVYAGGIADGAAFAYALACALPETFAGVGVVAGALVDFPVRADPWRPAGDALIGSNSRTAASNPDWSACGDEILFGRPLATAGR